jgi:hypothetical protein
VVETIPKFHGTSTEYAQGFIDHVNRVGVTEGWTNPQRLQVAVRRLTGTAQQWQIQAGYMQNNWFLWSAAFVDSFSQRLSFTEWNRMVEARRQRLGETGMEYALDKLQLCRLSPVQLDDRQIIAFLINGLLKLEHVAALTAAIPPTVNDFLNRIREIERYGIAVSTDAPYPAAHAASFHPAYAPPITPSVATVAPPATPDIRAALSTFGDKLVNELSSRMEAMAIRSAPRVDTRPREHHGPPRCYNCNGMGHISKYCPHNRSASGNPSRGIGPPLR